MLQMASHPACSTLVPSEFMKSAIYSLTNKLLCIFTNSFLISFITWFYRFYSLCISSGGFSRSLASSSNSMDIGIKCCNTNIALDIIHLMGSRTSCSLSQCKQN